MTKTHAQLSEFEKAKVEYELFQNRKKEGSARFIISLICKSLGITKYKYVARRCIYILGDDAKPLWEKIDDGLPLGVAHGIARKTKRNQHNIQEAIRTELKKYEKPDYSELKKLHKNTNEFGKAKIEFNLISKLEWRLETNVPEKVQEILEINQYEYTNRLKLYMAGEVASPLWTKMNKGMPLGTAVRLFQQAKRKHLLLDLPSDLLQTPKSMLEAIKIEIENHEKRTTRVPETKVPETNGQTTPIEVDSQFWGDLKTTISDFVDKKTYEIDEIQREQLKREFEIDLKSLVGEWQTKLYRASKCKLNLVAVISRRKLVQACHTLKIDPPGMGDAVNLEKANKQKKQLARLYHPDMHGGKETTREQYEEVIKAYLTLEEYNKLLEVNHE